MFEQLGISWVQAGLVALTTLAMYGLLIGCVRVFGQRRLAGMSSVDLGCVMALGAVVGRTALLLRPTLAAGVVATMTLFAVQAGLSRLRRHGRADRLLDRPPVLLMADARLLHDNLRAHQVTEGDLRQRLRLAGIRHLDEVRYVVLERTGALSVIRQGESLDPWLLADLPDRDRLRPADRGGEVGALPEHDTQAPPA